MSRSPLTGSEYPNEESMRLQTELGIKEMTAPRKVPKNFEELRDIYGSAWEDWANEDVDQCTDDFASLIRERFAFAGEVKLTSKDVALIKSCLEKAGDHSEYPDCYDSLDIIEELLKSKLANDSLLNDPAPSLNKGQAASSGVATPSETASASVKGCEHEFEERDGSAFMWCKHCGEPKP